MSAQSRRGCYGLLVLTHGKFEDLAGHHLEKRPATSTLLLPDTTLGFSDDLAAMTAAGHALADDTPLSQTRA